MIQLAALLAKPLLGRFAPDATKEKMAAVQTLLTGGSGEAWLPVARHQATLQIKGQVRSQSATEKRGEVSHEGKSLPWVQLDWPTEQQIDDCTLHYVCWRFYQNGLVCIETVASKDTAGFDTRDLLGHTIELRDRAGFLIGVWSAAFVVSKGADRVAFHASEIDDFLPLKLHFDEIAAVQHGIVFRI